MPGIFTTYLGSGSTNVNNFYRPIQELSNMLDWFIWDGDPFGFHLTNNLLHAIVSVLVFVLILNLSGKITLAFLTALIFSIHPIQTEAIAYIAGRADPLFSMFMLFSFILFMRHCNSIDSGKSSPLLLILSLSSFVLSLLSKEKSVILPLLILFYLLYFVKDKKVLFKKVRWHWTPYALTAFFYIVLRKTVLDFSTLAPSSTLSYFNLYSRIITFFRTVGIYLRLLVFPADLHIERALLVSKNIFVPLSGIFATSMIIILVWLAVKTYKRNRIVSFGIVWFFINLIPVSNIVPINSFIAEHWMYMASIGAFLIFSWAAINLYSIFEHKNIFLKTGFLVSVAIILSTLGYTTILRNRDWLTNESFFESTIKYRPSNARLYLHMGNIYYARGNVDKATGFYKKAVEVDPDYNPARANLAYAQLIRGNLDEAEKLLNEVLKLGYDSPIVRYNLGIIFFERGQYDQAIKELERTVERLPHFYKAWSLLGINYLEVNDIPRALRALETSLSIFPDQDQVRDVLDQVRKGDFAQGISL